MLWPRFGLDLVEIAPIHHASIVHHQEVDNARYVAGERQVVNLDGRPARCVANRTARVRVRRLS